MHGGAGCENWEQTKRRVCSHPFPPPATQYTKHTPCPSPPVRGEVQQASSFRNIVSEWEQSQDAFSRLNLPCCTVRTGLSRLSNIKLSPPFQTHYCFMKLYIYIFCKQSINETNASWVARLFGLKWFVNLLRELWRGEWSGRSEELSTREELRAGAILLHCKYYWRLSCMTIHDFPGFVSLERLTQVVGSNWLFESLAFIYKMYAA